MREIYVLVDNLYDGGYGAELYITYATDNKKEIEKYANENMSGYDRKQIELGYLKLSDLYKTVKLNKKQKTYLGGYVE